MNFQSIYQRHPMTEEMLYCILMVSTWRLTKIIPHSQIIEPISLQSLSHWDSEEVQSPK